MLRGEVYGVSFDDATGGEVRKHRPAVIISNNTSNKFSNRVQVVPLSSKVGKLYPCETMVHLLNAPSKAMADQIATVSKHRVGKRMGELSPHEMQAVEDCIRVQLAL